ncbi:MAG TPA: DNA ligase D [Caulobacteraceae bacterium]|nr:DNA ligase D [Caulobacteraceae bacterium]
MARTLKKYQSMRDFGVTAEPSGKTPAPKSNRLRFVIQKHAATRLHFDLRLEWDGVFLSWAVTKGPSVDPKDRRLAVEVEDHPLSYGDFEGTIPKGQYGGGTVMLWDRGYWEPQDGFDIAKGLKKGELKVVFDGERMKGSWVLVRMPRREREKRDNWLMIKHRDGTEIEGAGNALVDENMTSIASGRTMEEIAAGKGKAPSSFISKVKSKANAVWNSNRGDPEASAETEAVKHDAPKAPAKARPKTPANIPGFVEPQLCKLLDRPPQGAGWAHEIKFDGYRMQMRVEAGAATLKTRKGLDWSGKFREIVAEGRSLPDCLIDGEVVALNENGSPDFAGLQAAISSGKTRDLIFYVFDLMFAEGEDLRRRPLSERKQRLKALLETYADAKAQRLRYVDHFVTAGDAVLESACRMDLEGIVSKKLDAPYQSGRGETWTKSKCRAGQEVVIGGWTTTGDSFRSLIVGVHRDGKFVHAGRVGTGFNGRNVPPLLKRLRALETDKSPFEVASPKKKPDIHWVKPELVAEIEFAGFTGDGNVRQASFKGLREDKPASEVAHEIASVEEAELATPTPRPKKASPAKPAAKQGDVVMGVTISNPDKALWPDAGDGQPVTKLELARYYEAIGPWMMEHLKGRPCSIIRMPDGINGSQRFFQRHVGKGSSALINEVEVYGDHKPYLQVDRIEALAALAQIGAVELHPWNNQPNDQTTPGRLIFDLDPDEELGFPMVIKAAHEVKERLEALELEAFCKTTGGKGLHVVTPLLKPKKTMDWPTAKAFAREVCARMAADSPDRYTINMAKKVRGGRIFLDYLRNDRLSTAVAPLSPRGRPGAPVSFPIEWKDVKVGLNPKKWTIRTAPALLAKTKAWSGYCDAERPLEDAIAKLGKIKKAA